MTLIVVGIIMIVPAFGLVYAVKAYLERRGENKAMLPELSQIGVEDEQLPTIDREAQTAFKPVEFTLTGDEGADFFKEINEADGSHRVSVVGEEMNTRRARRQRRAE
jgi:hypothetical protein